MIPHNSNYIEWYQLTYTTVRFMTYAFHNIPLKYFNSILVLQSCVLTNAFRKDCIKCRGLTAFSIVGNSYIIICVCMEKVSVNPFFLKIYPSI